MHTLRSTLIAVLLLLPTLGLAQPSPEPARGEVAALDGDNLVLKVADGTIKTIALAKDWTVTVLKPVTIDAIQPGSFIGTAEMPQKNGTGRSLEVHVFPPGVKAGEGHYAWDLRPGSMMTNGTVGEVSSKASGRELLVSYPNGQRRIIVPKDVPIVQFTSGERALVKPGVPVFLVVVKSATGELTSRGVAVGADGATPPM